jgi:hypothetical protein
MRKHDSHHIRISALPKKVCNFINMPEIENTNQAAAEGEEVKTEGGEGQEGADSKKEAQDTDTGKEDAGEGKEEGGEGDKKETSTEGKDAKAQEKETSQQGKDDNQEPPTRKGLSTQDFIIGRKHRQLTKAKAGEEGGEDNKTGDDDEIAPEDEELINKVVAKNFAPIFNKTIAAEDDKEIGAFLKDNPDFAPYEAKARRYIAHPSRKHLPIKAVFYEVAGDDLLKLGAERGKKADEKAKGTQTGGGSNRSGEGKKDAWELSKEEFEAEQEKVRRGQA